MRDRNNLNGPAYFLPEPTLTSYYDFWTLQDADDTVCLLYLDWSPQYSQLLVVKPNPLLFCILLCTLLCTLLQKMGSNEPFNNGTLYGHICKDGSPTTQEWSFTLNYPHLGAYGNVVCDFHQDPPYNLELYGKHNILCIYISMACPQSFPMLWSEIRMKLDKTNWRN